jgi:hypothetical protein
MKKLKVSVETGQVHMDTKTPNLKPVKPVDWNSPDFEIPELLRYPANGTREASEMMIQSIDVKIEKLAKLGLRPHPIMLGYRQELVEQLDGNGPYRLRVTSMML